MLKSNLAGAQASGKSAHAAVSALALPTLSASYYSPANLSSADLAFTGAFTADADDHDPQPPTPTPTDLLSPDLFDAGCINLDASMLGVGAMSFVLTDVLELTMSAASIVAGTRTSANSATALKAQTAMPSSPEPASVRAW